MPCPTATVYRPSTTPATISGSARRGYRSPRALFAYGRHSQPNRTVVLTAVPLVMEALIESTLPAGMFAVAVLVHVVAKPLIVQVTAVSVPLTLIVNARLAPMLGGTVSMTDKFWAVQAVLEESVWWIASTLDALETPTTGPKLLLPT